MTQTCDFCYRHCHIPDGGTGFCGVRRNNGGKLVSPYYGKLVSLALDPIEKKPLYHFLPGSQSLSLAEPGCNYSCDFCQNYEISQKGFSWTTEDVSPEEVVGFAQKANAQSVSYTYSEPSVWQDYMIAVATLVHQDGRRNVMVTNGSFSAESRERIFSVIDAFNIDVKGDETYYRTVCHADLQPVLDNVEAVSKAGLHQEITTLVIQGIHTEGMITQLGKELSNRGVQVWHLSRFFPRYRMEDRKATSEAFLNQMLQAARQSGIPYIYAGNSSHVDQTFCPKCHTLLIHSHDYQGTQRQDVQKNIPDGRCAVCGQQIYGVFG
jgi:pyruvate formate lyase activating enzyme